MMLSTILLAGVAAVSAIDTRGTWLTFAGDEAVSPGNGRRIVFVAGDEEYRSEETMPMLARLLNGQGYECVVLMSQDPATGIVDPDNLSHIPGLELIDGADGLVLQLRFRELSDDDMKHIVDHIESGKPVVGVRTSTHAFNYLANKESPYARWTWNSQDPSGGFGREILGETWIAHHGHHGQEATRGVPNADAITHPVLRGVVDVFGPTDVYAVKSLPDDATVLLHGEVVSGMTPDDAAVTGSKNEPMHPVAWVRERAVDGDDDQRIVTITMGAAQDFSSHDLRRLFLQGVMWAVGDEAGIPEDGVDASMIGDWEPTPFGFGGHRPGYVPEEYRNGSPWASVEHAMDGHDDFESYRRQNEDRVRVAIETECATFESLLPGSECEALADLYTADGVIVPPFDLPVLQGREAIIQWWQIATGREGHLWIDFMTLNVQLVSPTAAIETGRYAIGPAKGEIADAGSYTAVWKRIDSKWRIDRQVIVSSVESP
jgi:ketosteroid isomerase-like protein